MKKLLKWGAIGLGGFLVLLMVMGAIITVLEDSPEASKLEAAEATTQPTLPPTPSPRQIVVDAVIDVLGKSNRDVEGAFSDSHRGQAVSLSDDGVITVQWAINDNLSSGFVKRGARNDVLDVLRAVHESGVPYGSILTLGTFSLVDIYGNSSEEVVVRAVYDRSTVEKIDWDNFLSDNIYRIADGEVGAMIHKTFRD